MLPAVTIEQHSLNNFTRLLTDRCSNAMATPCMHNLNKHAFRRRTSVDCTFLEVYSATAPSEFTKASALKVPTAIIVVNNNVRIRDNTNPTARRDTIWHTSVPSSATDTIVLLPADNRSPEMAIKELTYPDDDVTAATESRRR